MKAGAVITLFVSSVWDSCDHQMGWLVPCSRKQMLLTSIDPGNVHDIIPAPPTAVPLAGLEVSLLAG